MKKGYFVIRKDKPMGLTDSWNKGYQLAVSMVCHIRTIKINVVSQLIFDESIDMLRPKL